MKKFIRDLKTLKGKKCAVIGLGDSKYNVEYVIESASLLEKAVKDKGGEFLIKPLRINKTPVPHLNTNIKDWAQKLYKSIK
jgi:flavodoxin